MKYRSLMRKRLMDKYIKGNSVEAGIDSVPHFQTSANNQPIPSRFYISDNNNHQKFLRH